MHVSHKQQRPQNSHNHAHKPTTLLAYLFRTFFTGKRIFEFAFTFVLSVLVTRVSIDMFWHTALVRSSNPDVDLWSWTRFHTPLAFPSFPADKLIYLLAPWTPNQATTLQDWFPLIAFFVVLHMVVFWLLAKLIQIILNAKTEWGQILDFTMTAIMFALWEPNYWIVRNRSFSILFFVLLLWLIYFLHRMRYVHYINVVMLATKEKYDKFFDTLEEVLVMAVNDNGNADNVNTENEYLSDEDTSPNNRGEPTTKNAEKFSALNSDNTENILSEIEQDEAGKQKRVKENALHPKHSGILGFFEAHWLLLKFVITKTVYHVKRLPVYFRVITKWLHAWFKAWTTEIEEQYPDKDVIVPWVQMRDPSVPKSLTTLLRSYWFYFIVSLLLFFVWVNTHGGWLLGLPLLYLIFYYSMAPKLQKLLYIIAIALIGVFGNIYYGIDTIRLFLIPELQSNSIKSIQEWANTIAMLGVVPVFAVLFIIAYAMLRPQKKRYRFVHDIYSIMLTIALMYEGIMHLRVFIFLVAWALFYFSIARFKNKSGYVVRRLFLGFFTVVVFGSFFSSSLIHEITSGQWFMAKVVTNNAIHLKQDITTRGLEQPVNIYNHFSYGAHLDYYSNDGQDYKVFIDGRVIPPYDDNLMLLFTRKGVIGDLETASVVSEYPNMKYLLAYLAVNNVRYVVTISRDMMLPALITLNDSWVSQGHKPFVELVYEERFEGFQIYLFTYYVDSEEMLRALGNFDETECGVVRHYIDQQDTTYREQALQNLNTICTAQP